MPRTGMLLPLRRGEIKRRGTPGAEPIRKQLIHKDSDPAAVPQAEGKPSNLATITLLTTDYCAGKKELRTPKFQLHVQHLIGKVAKLKKNNVYLQSKNRITICCSKKKTNNVHNHEK